MKYIPQQIEEFFSFWINAIYNTPELGWCFISILLPYILVSLIIKIHRSRWDGGIDKKIQKNLQKHCPFDPSKGILYISRRVVGFWESKDKIHNLQNEASYKVLLNNLSQRFNLILYIPEKDKYTKVYVTDLVPSIKFIVDNGFPICYITQHIPPRNKVKPFSYNDETLWFVEYKKELLRWEEFT